MEFFQLLVGNYIRSFRHLVNSALCLREGNDITNGFAMEHKHYQTVQTKGKAFMRRCAVLECLKQESKFFFCFFLGNSDSLEYLFLQVFLVNTKAAATGFYAIEDHIIGLSVNLFRIGEQILNIFITRCSEWMMFCHITLFFLAYQLS